MCVASYGTDAALMDIVKWQPTLTCQRTSSQHT